MVVFECECVPGMCMIAMVCVRGTIKAMIALIGY